MTQILASLLNTGNAAAPGVLAQAVTGQRGPDIGNGAEFSGVLAVVQAAHKRGSAASALALAGAAEHMPQPGEKAQAFGLQAKATAWVPGETDETTEGTGGTEGGAPVPVEGQEATPTEGGAETLLAALAAAPASAQPATPVAKGLLGAQAPVVPVATPGTAAPAPTADPQVTAQPTTPGEVLAGEVGTATDEGAQTLTRALPEVAAENAHSKAQGGKPENRPAVPASLTPGQTPASENANPAASLGPRNAAVQTPAETNAPPHLEASDQPVRTPGTPSPQALAHAAPNSAVATQMPEPRRNALGQNNRLTEALQVGDSTGDVDGDAATAETPPLTADAETDSLPFAPRQGQGQGQGQPSFLNQPSGNGLPFAGQAATAADLPAFAPDRAGPAPLELSPVAAAAPKDEAAPKPAPKPFADALLTQIRAVTATEGRTVVNLHPRGLGTIEIEA